MVAYFSRSCEFMFLRSHPTCVLLFQCGFKRPIYARIQEAFLLFSDISLPAHEKPSEFHYFSAASLSSLSSLIQLSGTSYFRPAARFPISSTSRSILSFSLTVKDHKHVPFVLIFIEHINIDITNERTFALCGLLASLGTWEEK
jgi:hypothetical protein